MDGPSTSGEFVIQMPEQREPERRTLGDLIAAQVASLEELLGGSRPARKRRGSAQAAEGPDDEASEAEAAADDAAHDGGTE